MACPLGMGQERVFLDTLEKAKPGMRPRFLSQKMEANEPEKKMPSTAAKAMRRSANVARSSAIHLDLG